LSSSRFITDLRSDSPAFPLTTIFFYFVATLLKVFAFFISN
jgi:hypothetical protein